MNRRIIEKGNPPGWCKLKLAKGEYLKNTAGAVAVIPVETARVRCFTGDYSPPAVGDCYAVAENQEKN